MKRNTWMHLIVGGALILTAGTARAQGPHHGGPGFGGGPMELMGFEGGHDGKVVTGAPYSATATAQTTSTLQDGTAINRTAQLTLARDSQGRVRRELTATGFGPLAASGAPKTMIMISDPVAGVHYMLDTTAKVAHKEALRSPGTSSDAETFQQRMAAREAKEIADGTLKKESLGTQVINGVSAEGTRTTKIIPAGKIGNDKAIQIVSERWYSPDLQIVVKSTHTDPQSGTTTYSVTNLQRAEPAATQFAVPSGYTVEAGRPHGRGPGGPGGPSADAPPPPSEQ